MRERMQRFDIYMKIKNLNDNQVTEQCGLSQGLIGQARTGKSDLGSKTIDKILLKYQDLNRVWLLTGVGEMLNSNINQSVEGNNNTSVAGNSNNVNSSSTIDKAIDEISAQRKLTEKAMAQIEKLVDIINQLSKS